MEAAVANYAGYRAGDDRWMLGRFVVPAARLDELAAAAVSLLPPAGAEPWPISALLGEEAALDLDRVAAFNAQHRGRAVVDAVELRATTSAEIELVATALAGATDPLEAYVEVPLDPDPSPLLAAVVAAGLRAKARTGGVIASAIPSSDALARFLVACATLSLPLKATAGLHHPLRAEYRLTYAPDAPRGTMYGFVNVFLASALARAGVDQAGVRAALEERDPTSFAFDDTGVSWRDARIGVADLRAARAHASAFGSCSFDEPTTELRALGWL